MAGTEAGQRGQVLHSPSERRNVVRGDYYKGTYSIRAEYRSDSKSRHQHRLSTCHAQQLHVFEISFEFALSRIAENDDQE